MFLALLCFSFQMPETSLILDFGSVLHIHLHSSQSSQILIIHIHIPPWILAPMQWLIDLRCCFITLPVDQPFCDCFGIPELWLVVLSAFDFDLLSCNKMPPGKRPSLRRQPSIASSPGKRCDSEGDELSRRKKRSKSTMGTEPASSEIYAGVIMPGINPWEPDPSLSLEEIFTSEITGSLRIEKIFDIFGDPRNEYVDVKWFDVNGKPAIEADPVNRPLQLSTVAEYEQRLFDAGLADDCSGFPSAT